MPTNTSLTRGQRATLGVSSCGPVDRGAALEETEPTYTLVFPLSGVFRVEDHRGVTSATPAKVLFFSGGSSHLISHPFGGHDTSLFITVSAEIAETHLDSGGAFSRSSAPTPRGTGLRLAGALTAARRGSLSALAVETLVVDLLHTLQNPANQRSVAPSSQRLVSDAEDYLAAHFSENCDLPKIADAVGASPHHLSRTFKAVTGESMARRRIRLRLGSVLGAMESGADDLSRVAVDSGFYDHAHMTNAFKAEFGMTPTRARQVVATKPRNDS